MIVTLLVDQESDVIRLRKERVDAVGPDAQGEGAFFLSFVGGTGRDEYIDVLALVDGV